MSIEEWWPKLKPSTREWLIENNGDAVPTEVVAEIAEAGGSVATGVWRVGKSGSSGFYFSDDAVDWIEAVGSGESPEPRCDSWPFGSGLRHSRREVQVTWPAPAFPLTQE